MLNANKDVKWSEGKAPIYLLKSTWRVLFRQFLPLVLFFFLQHWVDGFHKLKVWAGWQISLQVYLQGQPLYIMFYASAIIFFCFFYTALTFNAKDTADNLRKSGGFIPGIRPGQHSADYIDSVTTRLTAVGAIYITAVCLLPEFLILYWNVPVLFWWHQSSHHRCCGDGFYRSSAVSYDVKSV